ncbi:MAG: hypothetical protein WDN04_02410 [Rhodospirillales bacterium]
MAHGGEHRRVYDAALRVGKFGGEIAPFSSNASRVVPMQRCR